MTEGGPAHKPMAARPLVHVCLHRFWFGSGGHGSGRVLQAMPGQRADDGILTLYSVIEVTAPAELDQAGYGGGGRRFTEHPLHAREERIGFQMFKVGHLFDQPRRLFARPARAFSQLAGLPMRITVATCRAHSQGRSCTIGAAPAAWKPNIWGVPVARPSRATPCNPANRR